MKIKASKHLDFDLQKIGYSKAKGYQRKTKLSQSIFPSNVRKYTAPFTFYLFHRQYALSPL